MNMREKKEVDKGKTMKRTTKEVPDNGSVEDDVPCCCSKRWILAYMSFLGLIGVYCIRLNLSVAIVCMVKTRFPEDEIDTNVTYDQEHTCEMNSSLSMLVNEHAEFDWPKSTQSALLSSFFYGYLLTPILGGWLSDRFGGRKVFGFAMAVASIATILTPLCARSSLILFFSVRILVGLVTGLTLPAIQSMWGRWAPPNERSKLISVTFIGTVLGSFIAFSASGILCEVGFDNGWGSIFYVTGAFALIVTMGWFKVTAETPRKHRRISQAELKYISGSIDFNTNTRTAKVPWRKMMTSKPFLALIYAHVCSNFLAYSLQILLPTFMKEILHYNAKNNGLLSSVPFLIQAIVGFCAGHFADFLLSKGYLQKTKIRKIFQITSLTGGCLFLIAAGFIPCDKKEMAVVSVTLAALFMGFNRPGYTSNHGDIGPKYAGLLYGITNTFATLPGMVSPLLAALMTPNGTREEWLYFFCVICGIAISGAVVFGLFASGELQDWSRDENKEVSHKDSDDSEEKKEKEITEFDNIGFDENETESNNEEKFCKIYTVQIDDNMENNNHVKSV